MTPRSSLRTPTNQPRLHTQRWVKKVAALSKARLRYTGVLASELGEGEGERLYRKRKQISNLYSVTPKHNRGVTRFHRRGRTAVRTEWRLLMAAHNLTKLHRHQIATAGP